MDITPTRYGKKTLVSGWNYDESHPKDYDPYAVFGGNHFRSTYHRLGTWTEDEMKTDTSEAQKAALVKHHRPVRNDLINMLTYPGTLGENRQKYWPMCGIKLTPESADNTDYTSVYKDDYLNFHPERPKIKLREEVMKPEIKFRRLLVNGADPRRPGMNTFYDDNMEYLRVRSKEKSTPPYDLSIERRIKMSNTQ